MRASSLDGRFLSVGQMFDTIKIERMEIVSRTFTYAPTYSKVFISSKPNFKRENMVELTMSQNVHVYKANFSSTHTKRSTS